MPDNVIARKFCTTRRVGGMERPRLYISGSTLHRKPFASRACSTINKVVLGNFSIANS